MIFPNIKVQPHWLKTLEDAVEILPHCLWVCSAVSLGTEPETGQEIRKAIVQAIAPANFVSSWIFLETGATLSSGKESKEYRIAWLNHMIEQCRSMQPKEQT